MIGFVLHAHLPWLRGRGDTIALEESWFFEALWESYLPLVAVFERLAEQRPSAPLLTFSVSPTLLSMLADPALSGRFARFADELDHSFEKMLGDRTEWAAAIRDHRQRLADSRRTFQRIRGDVIGALVRLDEAGVLELATTVATHAFLPGARTAAAVRAQIRMGMRYFQTVTKRMASTLWLPECGYDERLETILGDSGAHCTVLASHGVAFARPRPIHGVMTPIVGEGPFAYFGRCDELVELVWSPEHGYPSHAHYREFYGTVGNLKPFRVTGGAGAKAPYEPAIAAQRTALDADHFVSTARRLLSSSEAEAPIAVAAFDAELFGHWWWEGPEFLRAVFQRLARDGEATSLGAYLGRDPLLPVAKPATSTWGRGGYADVWTHPANGHAARIVHRAERRVLTIDALVRDTPRTETQRQARLWAIRELFLLQASDYAFMLRTGEFASFAERKLKEHAGAIDRLSQIAERPAEAPDDRAFVDGWIERRPLFRELDEDAWSDTFDPW